MFDKIELRFSRRNRRQVTIGTADMKRINRRYTSMKKYLRIDRDKMDKEHGVESFFERFRNF